jgi:hypothetical protein
VHDTDSPYHLEHEDLRTQLGLRRPRKAAAGPNLGALPPAPAGRFLAGGPVYGGAPQRPPQAVRQDLLAAGRALAKWGLSTAFHVL